MPRRLWPSPSLPARLRVLPAPALRIIALLASINALLWALLGATVLRAHPALLSPAVLSYTLGLRHALDADHITAIDLVTRRLIFTTPLESSHTTHKSSDTVITGSNKNGKSSQNYPVTVGTFFSLGHSTIVVLTCVVVAATSGALRDRFARFERVGAVVGTAVSATVLLLLCAGNAWVLFRLVGRLRRALELAPEVDGDMGQDQDQDQHQGQHEGQGLDQHRDLEIGAGPVPTTANQATSPAPAPPPTPATPNTNAPKSPRAPEGPPLAGFLATVFRKLFRLIDRPWKMYPLGVLFGLGFDTSSEIAVLGIASIQGARGTSLWVILIFPLLFTGMCLLDTTDGALMTSLYTSKALLSPSSSSPTSSSSPSPIPLLYYSTVLTFLTVLVALFVGVVQALSLAQNVLDDKANGRFWAGLGALGDHFDIVGGAICALFVLVGVGSVLLYKPWRRWVGRRVEWERRRRAQHPQDDEQGGGAIQGTREPESVVVVPVHPTK